MSCLEILEKFILEKLDLYNGNRTFLQAIKKNQSFYSTVNGNISLASFLTENNLSILDTNKILSFPELWLKYPYFSKFIIKYYDINKGNIDDILEDLIFFLEKHNSNLTNKRLISKLIIQANKPEYSHLQVTIEKIAFTKIGDPNDIAKWSVFENATESENREILSAKNILNEWITREFINVFFRVCINDARRKRFWLNIATKTKLTFKVYGSKYTKFNLKQINSISDYVDSRFETVSSNTDKSAFILYIGDYMLIEFSNEGYALYAYKNNSRYKPILNGQLNSVDSLRNGFMPFANLTNDEGRLTHRDGNQIWEVTINNWLNQKVL